MQIAEAAGAAQYAPDILAKAKQELQNAQALDSKKSQRKVMITYARGAVQDAEDARVSTLRKMQQEKEQQQQTAMQQAQAAAQQAQIAAQQQALKRAQADAQAAQAEAAAANARAAQAAAEHSAQQATNQTEEMRERLRQQLSQVLQTQETARGLIVNMSDVLFDTGKYTLKPEAREKLAKVSGILLAYPEFEGAGGGLHRQRRVGSIQPDAFSAASRCGPRLSRFAGRGRPQHHCDRLWQERIHRRQRDGCRKSAEPPGATWSSPAVLSASRKASPQLRISRSLRPREAWLPPRVRAILPSRRVTCG